MYPKRDSNSQAFRPRLLRPLCLPIPPTGYVLRKIESNYRSSVYESDALPLSYYAVCGIEPPSQLKPGDTSSILHRLRRVQDSNLCESFCRAPYNHSNNSPYRFNFSIHSSTLSLNLPPTPWSPST